MCRVFCLQSKLRTRCIIIRITYVHRLRRRWGDYSGKREQIQIWITRDVGQCNELCDKFVLFCVDSHTLRHAIFFVLHSSAGRKVTWLCVFVCKRSLLPLKMAWCNSKPIRPMSMKPKEHSYVSSNLLWLPLERVAWPFVVWTCSGERSLIPVIRLLCKCIYWVYNLRANERVFADTSDATRLAVYVVRHPFHPDFFFYHISFIQFMDHRAIIKLRCAVWFMSLHWAHFFARPSLKSVQTAEFLHRFKVDRTVIAPTMAANE